MKLLSDVVNNGHPGINVGKCIVCGKLQYCTLHTEYGFLHVCKDHTDKEIAEAINKANREFS